MNLTNDEIKIFNEFAGFLSFKPTWLIKNFINHPAKIRCLFTGNQEGKTATIAHEYVMRILGRHPNPKKNLKPTDPIRTFRFCSQTLPNDPTGGEVKNTQYPAFKRYLPPSLVKGDITIRKPVITIKDPQGGPDIYVEFVSFSQDVQATAGVQRVSSWIDESSSKEFYEEQIPRLLAADGDLIYSLTPAEFIGWEYDELFQRAKWYYRTQAIINRFKERFGVNHKSIEANETGEDIAVFMAATDDNPSLTQESINGMFNLIEDEDIIDIRRYGIFRQTTGQVFKEFQRSIHIIEWDKYWPDGKLPYDWLHARGCDYHERNNWAIPFVALSQNDEMFVYEEYNPSPEKMITYEIVKNVAIRSKDYRYGLNLIDARAANKLPNTGSTTLEDVNRYFHEFKREGIGTGGYWQTWDSKATVGRERLKERLRNSKIVGKPFNNKIHKDQREVCLPTIWFLSNCRETIASMKNWRWEEWAHRDQLLVKDLKDKPEGRWSHFPIALECLLKHPGFNRGKYAGSSVPKQPAPHNAYFGARA